VNDYQEAACVRTQGKCRKPKKRLSKASTRTIFMVGPKVEILAGEDIKNIILVKRRRKSTERTFGEKPLSGGRTWLGEEKNN